ncbi:hypothetical protein CEQ90_05560 [Lewinellaceae bacterium SD302]|nr:hypothetical protein CEQ90_05560 [Lewinellaceae bacterium SD302]
MGPLTITTATLKSKYLIILLAIIFVACNPPVNKRHILIIGDDYAAGRDGWVQAFQRIRKGGPLLNTAVMGATTAFPNPSSPQTNSLDQLVPNLRRGFAEMGAVDEVIVQLGLNDCQKRYQAGSVEQSVSFRELIAEIDSFFLKRGQDAPRIVLVSPPPLAADETLDATFAGGADCVARITANVQQLANSRDLCFVDLSANPLLETYRNANGYTYTQEGLEIMARSILKNCY